MNIMFLTSVFEFASAIELCNGGGGCADLRAFAVAAGLISMLLIIVHQLGSTDRCCNRFTHKSQLVVSFFLFFWWVIAVAVLTFTPTFPFSSSGYWATWATFTMSVLHLHHEFEQVHKLFAKVASKVHARSRSAVVIMIGSCIVLGDATRTCLDLTCSTEDVLALTLAGVSLLVSLPLVFWTPEKLGNKDRYIATLLMLIWTSGVAIFIYIGPFTEPGNGFIATWACFFCSFMLFGELGTKGKKPELSSDNSANLDP